MEEDKEKTYDFAHHHGSIEKVSERGRLMASIEQATDRFVADVLISDEYLAYKRELDRLKEFPELKQQVDEFRKKNYELQLRGDLNFDKLDQFEQEYEIFRQNPLVSEFLQVELDLCRALQRVTMRVTEAVSFE